MATHAPITGAPTRAPIIPYFPEPTIATTPFRAAQEQHRIATAIFEALPSGLEMTDPATYADRERAFLDTVRVVDATPVADWDEFADAFEIACSGGDSLPSEDLIFKLLADVRRMRGNFNALHAEYRRLKDAENRMPLDCPEEEPAFEAATDQTSDAFTAMMALPTSEPAHLAAKLAALAEMHDVFGSCGFDRDAGDTLFADIIATLTLPQVQQ